MEIEKENVFVTWEEFDKLTTKLAEIIEDDNIKYNSIVSIARGGLVVGRMLSDKLQLPLHTIHTNRFEIGNNHSTKSIASGIVTGNNELFGNILVVDDLTNSGMTLEKVIVKLKRKDSINLVKSATIFNKTKSKFNPNYYIKETNKWIVFPYEIVEFQKMNKIST